MVRDSIPTSFSHGRDLVPLLIELDTQADAVLASIFVLQNLHWKYANSTNPEERSDYAVVLREHGVALETDLGIIKLDAELITDERLEAWVNTAASDAERKSRTKRLDMLVEKMGDLEKTMAELREMVGDRDSFL